MTEIFEKTPNGTRHHIGTIDANRTLPAGVHETYSITALLHGLIALAERGFFGPHEIDTIDDDEIEKTAELAVAAHGRPSSMKRGAVTHWSIKKSRDRHPFKRNNGRKLRSRGEVRKTGEFLSPEILVMRRDVLRRLRKSAEENREFMLSF